MKSIGKSKQYFHFRGLLIIHSLYSKCECECKFVIEQWLYHSDQMLPFRFIYRPGILLLPVRLPSFLPSSLLLALWLFPQIIISNDKLHLVSQPSTPSYDSLPLPSRCLSSTTVNDSDFLFRRKVSVPLL